MEEFAAQHVWSPIDKGSCKLRGREPYFSSFGEFACSKLGIYYDPKVAGSNGTEAGGV